MACLAMVITGCQQRSNTAWEETKSIGRHVARKGKLLWRGDVESRAIQDSDEFTGPVEEEFIPLHSDDLKLQAGDQIAQAKATPGSPQSGIPGIESFRSPEAALAAIFRTLHFNTNEHVVRTKEDFATIDRIATYLKAHPNTYIFVAGHCDERASEAYNLALGTRRANTVRSLLVKRGVSPEQIFTISYGKEKPSALGHDAVAWAQNRRAEFKFYEKRS